MKKEKFIELLSKKLSGDLVEEDRILLERTTKDNEEYRLLEIKLDRHFKEASVFKPNSAKLSDIWETIEINQRVNFDGKFDYSTPGKKTFLNTGWLKIAAVLVVLLGISLFSYRLLKDDFLQNSETLTTTEEKTFKMLDDGTRVWLNKKSSMKYNKAFGKHKREIILDGEAYFDVVKNTAIPLFIHAGGIDIEVKGTAFNVNAYKGSDIVQVALVRGSIAVTDRRNPKSSVLLKPNDKLLFSNKIFRGENHYQIFALKPTAVLKEASWMADTLTFNKEKLLDLAVRMEKKYDVKIEIRSEILKEKRFSGTFTNETIHQALEALKLSYPLTYTIQQRLIIIKD